MGARQGTVLSDRNFAGADVLATAYTLSQGIKKSGSYDLILCGKQTTDGDTAQVGAEVSEFLGISNVANVLSIKDVRAGKIFLTASLDDKISDLSVKMPCLISVDGDINSPRLPSYKVRKTVTDEKIKFLSLNEFDDKSPENYGLLGSATQVERIFPPEKNSKKSTIDGTAEEKAEGIYSLICQCKLI